jgi:putative transposase
LVAFIEFLVMLVIPASQRSIANWLGHIWTKPIHNSILAGSVLGAVLDLCRSKRELVVENALLRQQLIVLRRQVNQPQISNTDRALLVLLAGRLRTWKSALFIVQPDTLLRWH